MGRGALCIVSPWALSFPYFSISFFKKLGVTPGRMDFVAEMRKCGCQAQHNELHNSAALRVLRRLHPKGLFRVDAEMTEDPGGLESVGKCAMRWNRVDGMHWK